LDGLEKEGRVAVFHAGTRTLDNGWVTAGGRVLAVTGFGKTLENAVVRAYQGVKRVSFKNVHFRNDIAAKALKNRRISQRIRRMKERKEAALGRA
jgi:phosphoribosylamine--glycine ligase